MKFSGTIKATKEFKTAISSIEAFTDEATFLVNDKGIQFRGLEPSHVRYMEVMFPRDKFIKYNVPDETKFTIRPNEFLEIIKRAKNDEEVTLEMEADGKPLQIYLGGKKHYTLSLLAIDHDAPNPNFKFQVKATMKFSDFSDYVKDVAVVGYNFAVETDGTKMKISGRGDAGKVEIDADAEIEQTEEGALKSEYSTELLATSMKILGTSFDNAILEFGNELPLRLTLNSPDMGTLVYVQAHKQQ